jgi:hypothetical protein
VPAEQRRPTLVLAPVQFTKLPLAEPHLKPNLVARHRKPLEKPRLFTICTTPSRLGKVRNQEILFGSSTFQVESFEFLKA